MPFLSETVTNLPRIIVGMGIGVASMSVPVYMAETSPEAIRGTLGASFQVLYINLIGKLIFVFFKVMICFGQVVAAVVDALFGKMSIGWQYDFGLAGIPSLVLLVGFFFCPESPRFEIISIFWGLFDLLDF